MKTIMDMAQEEYDRTVTEVVTEIFGDGAVERIVRTDGKEFSIDGIHFVRAYVDCDTDWPMLVLYGGRHIATAADLL